MLDRLHRRALDLFFVSALLFCLSLFFVGEDQMPPLSAVLGYTSLLALAVLLVLTMARELREGR